LQQPEPGDLLDELGAGDRVLEPGQVGQQHRLAASVRKLAGQQFELPFLFGLFHW
jgi:hypothetical protein